MEPLSLMRPKIEKIEKTEPETGLKVERVLD